MQKTGAVLSTGPGNGSDSSSAGCCIYCDLPGEGFFDADAKLFFALFQDAGKLVQVGSVLFPDGGSELRVKFFGEADLLIADPV